MLVSFLEIKCHPQYRTKGHEKNLPAQFGICRNDPLGPGNRQLVNSNQSWCGPSHLAKVLNTALSGSKGQCAMVLTSMIAWQIGFCNLSDNGPRGMLWSGHWQYSGCVNITAHSRSRTEDRNLMSMTRGHISKYHTIHRGSKENYPYVVQVPYWIFVLHIKEMMVQNNSTWGTKARCYNWAHFVVASDFQI